jgi:hypothetical protein
LFEHQASVSAVAGGVVPEGLYVGERIAHSVTAAGSMNSARMNKSLNGKNLWIAAIVAALTSGLANVSAQNYTFTFDGSAGTVNGQTTFTETLGGVTISLQQGLDAGGVPIQADGNGVFVGNSATAYSNEIDYSFNKDVQVIGYTIGANSFATSPGHYGPKAGATVNAILPASPNGYFDISAFNYSIPQNASVRLFIDPTGAASDYFQVKSITISYTPVPEPGQTAALFGAVCGAGALWRRQRRRQVCP